MMPVNPKLKSLLLAVALPILSFAGSKTDTTKLNLLSRKMYDAGNKNFLLADAVKDGLLTEEQPYSYEYNDGEVIINGEQLLEPYRSRYAEKMEAFLQHQGDAHRQFAVTGSTLNLDKLYNEKRSKGANDKESEKQRKLDEVVTAMVSDGLLEENEPIKLMWYPSGLYVNGNKLEGEQEKKYTALMQDAVGFKPKLSTDSYIYKKGQRQ